jgi:hypothetical protein
MVERLYRTATTGELWLADSRGETEEPLELIECDKGGIFVGPVRSLPPD